MLRTNASRTAARSDDVRAVTGGEDCVAAAGVLQFLCPGAANGHDPDADTKFLHLDPANRPVRETVRRPIISVRPPSVNDVVTFNPSAAATNQGAGQRGGRS